MTESVARALLDTLDVDPRTALEYDGEEYDHFLVRSDVEASYTPEEFEEYTQSVVLKGFDDPPHQPALSRFGHLDTTIRWFHEVVMVQVPIDEWTGVIVTVDREDIDDAEAFVDSVLDHVEATVTGIDSDTSEESVAAERLEERFESGQ